MVEFLRAMRARLTPHDVGLPAGERRRLPGLRRQEVAQLAAVSVDWYIRLEQGRVGAPAYVIDFRFDILAHNQAAAAVFGAGFGTGAAANAARLLFLEPSTRA